MKMLNRVGNEIEGFLERAEINRDKEINALEDAE